VKGVVGNGDHRGGGSSGIAARASWPSWDASGPMATAAGPGRSWVASRPSSGRTIVQTLVEGICVDTYEVDGKKAALVRVTYRFDKPNTGSPKRDPSRSVRNQGMIVGRWYWWGAMATSAAAALVRWGNRA
jgi:hypothetical protein